MQIEDRFLKSYSRSTYQKVVKETFFSNKIPTVEIVPEGTILPVIDNGGGVIDKDGNFVKMSKQFVAGRTIEKGYFCEQVKEVHSNAIFAGYFQPSWGHFLVEMTTRLWYLLENNDPNIKVVFCLMKKRQQKMQGPYLELMELLGIKREQLIELRYPTRFTNVIVPEQAAISGVYYTNTYKNFFDKIRDSVPKKFRNNKSKIYFTRCGLAQAENDLGEKRIAKVFQENGYCIIEPMPFS